jgi:hypothetical protein
MLIANVVSPFALLFLIVEKPRFAGLGASFCLALIFHGTNIERSSDQILIDLSQEEPNQRFARSRYFRNHPRYGRLRISERERTLPNLLPGPACLYSRNAGETIPAVGMFRSIVQRALAAARQITADYILIEGNWRDAAFLLMAFTMSAGGRCGDTLRV